MNSRKTPTNLTELLIADEGSVSYAYTDSLGFWTIGVGRLIDRRKGGGISLDEIVFLLRNDVARIQNEVSLAFPLWFSLIDPVRQAVILSLCFILGLDGLKGFPKFLNACSRQDWSIAQLELLDSKLHLQDRDRCERLALQIATGAWQ